MTTTIYKRYCVLHEREIDHISHGACVPRFPARSTDGKAVDVIGYGAERLAFDAPAGDEFPDFGGDGRVSGGGDCTGGGENGERVGIADPFRLLALYSPWHYRNSPRPKNEYCLNAKF